MDKFRIAGGRPLEGRIPISGAKNSALPCLAAALLTPDTYDAATIEQRLVDPDFPLGRAVNLVSCRGTFCPTECGVQ